MRPAEEGLLLLCCALGTQDVPLTPAQTLSPMAPIRKLSSPGVKAGSLQKARTASAAASPAGLLKSHTCLPSSSSPSVQPLPRKKLARYQPLEMSICTCLPAALAAARMPSSVCTSSSESTDLS